MTGWAIRNRKTQEWWSGGSWGPSAKVFTSPRDLKLAVRARKDCGIRLNTLEVVEMDINLGEPVPATEILS